MRRPLQFVRQRKEELLLVLALSFGLVTPIRSIFHLTFWQSLSVAVPVGVILVVAFSWWLASRREKRNRPLRSEMHGDLGEVQFFTDHWEAVAFGPPFAGSVEVIGDANALSAQQLGLFRSIREQYGALVSAAIEGLSDELKAINPPVRPEELVLSSVWVSSRGDAFSFTFDVPTRKAKLPDGFYANFEGFELHEAGWVH